MAANTLPLLVLLAPSDPVPRALPTQGEWFRLESMMCPGSTLNTIHAEHRDARFTLWHDHHDNSLFKLESPAAGAFTRIVPKHAQECALNVCAAGGHGADVCLWDDRPAHGHFKLVPAGSTGGGEGSTLNAGTVEASQRHTTPPPCRRRVDINGALRWHWITFVTMLGSYVSAMVQGALSFPSSYLVAVMSAATTWVLIFIPLLNMHCANQHGVDHFLQKCHCYGIFFGCLTCVTCLVCMIGVIVHVIEEVPFAWMHPFWFLTFVNAFASSANLVAKIRKHMSRPKPPAPTAATAPPDVQAVEIPERNEEDDNVMQASSHISRGVDFASQWWGGASKTVASEAEVGEAARELATEVEVAVEIANPQTLAEHAAFLRQQLGLRGNLREVVHGAAAQLGIPSEGVPLTQLAKTCAYKVDTAC